MNNIDALEQMLREGIEQPSIDPVAAERIRRRWEEHFSCERRSSIAVLDDGLVYRPIPARRSLLAKVRDWWRNRRIKRIVLTFAIPAHCADPTDVEIVQILSETVKK